MMFRVISILSLTLMMAACGPTRHVIHVEMRHPSRSGIELAGKIVSIVYASDEDSQQNMVSGNMAEEFAAALETDYGTGKGSVGVYSVDRRTGSYESRDSLVSILMQTGSDMVFLLDAKYSEEKKEAGHPVLVKLYCYDGMDHEDKVRGFYGSYVLPANTDEELAKEAAKAGQRMSESFTSQWKHEQYSIAYYDSSKWYDSLIKAEQYDWKGAMEIWFGFLDSKDMMKRACAEYNIAVACYMMGDYDLAEQWLDRSDQDNRMPTLSDGLRKRIEARKR